MSGSKQDRSGNTGRNTIVIGQFNLSDYDRFSEYHRDGNLYFFHASTTWFIKDKRILKYLLRPGDFIEQEELDKIEESSMEFVRELEESSRSMSVEGISLMPLFRFWNIRWHSMLLESYVTLSECIKRYKPETVVIDTLCNRNSRGRIYNVVAECLSKRHKIHIDFLDNKEGKSGFNVVGVIQHYFKDQARKIISLIINSFCRMDVSKKTIIFSGSFNQMSQVMTWFADIGTYNIICYKQGIPLNKALFFLRNRIAWRRIPVKIQKHGNKKNKLLDNFVGSWFMSEDVIKKFFRGESLLSGLMSQFVKTDIGQNLDIINHLISTSSRLFSRVNKSAVVLDEDQTLRNRIIVDTANYNKKETFVICHGILGQRTNYIFSARNIFTYGKKVSQKIKNYSSRFQPDIYEIGTPRLDRLKRLNKFDARRMVMNNFSISSDKKIILFAMGNMFFNKEFYTNRLKEDTQMVIYKTVKRLIDMIKRNESLFLIIKLKDDGKEKKFVSDTYNIGESDRIKVTGAYDIDYLVSGCDLIINTKTTVSYHGLVAEKPVVRVKAVTDNELWEFRNTDAEEVIEIDSLLFEEKVMSLLHDEQKRKKFHQSANRCLLENYSNEDLRVRERLLNIIHDVLKK